MILSQKRHEKGLWWDRNWPVLEGCTPCSPACDNCFAAGYAHRFEKSLPYLRGLTTTDGKWNGAVALRKDQLKLPSTIKKPTVWFLTERSDLFHPAVPFEYILAVLTHAVMAQHHRYMILTKRPERMAEFFKWMDTEAPHRVETMRDCFWFGVTVWDQASADRSLPYLLGIRVAHRFISVEPMLGTINLEIIPGVFFDAGMPVEWQRLSIPGLDLVICGGETGLKARPVHPGWVRSLSDQCTAAKVPFFFKQWGEWAPRFDGVGREWPTRVGKKAAGRLIDGKEYLELPL